MRIRARAIVVLLSLTAFVGVATAKPSDWADVIEKPGDRAALPPPSQNAPDVVTKAKQGTKTTKATKATKAKKAKKAKKAPRRAKKKGRR